jgi:hypothetical protein
MKNLIIFLMFIISFSCKKDFGKEKYDVSLNFQNATQSKIRLSIFEINNKIKWENKEVSPNENLNIIFNVKRDIGNSEGAFIFKAYFVDGDSTILNSGYFTNFQFQDKNPKYYKVSKKGFESI